MGQKIKVRRDTDFSDIITAADRLCVPDLVDATQRDAAASLSANNVVTLANLAWSGLPALKALREATIEYLRAHFEELRTRDDLCCALRLPIFSSLVACPWLRVRDEDTLLMTILYRLSQGTHTKDEVVGLLGSVRLHLLDEDSLWTLSIIARGGTTGPVVETYEALQAGVTAVVLGGLSSMSAAPAGPSRLPLVRSRQRCAVVGRSGMVLWDPRGDQSRRVYSSAFRALGHKWKVDVHTHAKEGSPATLGAYLHLKSARELPVVARAYMWAVCVDSGGYFSPSMVVVRCNVGCVLLCLCASVSAARGCLTGVPWVCIDVGGRLFFLLFFLGSGSCPVALVQVAKPGTRILFQQTFTHEWKSMGAQGYPRVVDAATLDALRQDGRDAHVCVGVSITAVDGP